jgi:hypothetical protein
MPMSEKNESYLFDLLESLNSNLRHIRRILIGLSFGLGLFILSSLLILNS